MTKITQDKRKEIELGAKKILDNFASALSKVKVSSKKKEKESLSGFREEGNGKAGNPEFRKLMFSNAPSKSGDNIIAETKEW